MLEELMKFKLAQPSAGSTSMTSVDPVVGSQMSNTVDGSASRFRGYGPCTESRGGRHLDILTSEHSTGYQNFDLPLCRVLAAVEDWNHLWVDKGIDEVLPWAVDRALGQALAWLSCVYLHSNRTLPLMMVASVQ